MLRDFKKFRRLAGPETAAKRRGPLGAPVSGQKWPPWGPKIEPKWPQNGPKSTPGSPKSTPFGPLFVALVSQKCQIEGPNYS